MIRLAIKNHLPLKDHLATSYMIRLAIKNHLVPKPKVTAMSFAVTLSRFSLSPLIPPQQKQPPHFLPLNPKLHKIPNINPLQASRRISNFPQGSDVFAEDPRNWSRAISQDLDDDDDDDEDDDEEEDRSLDLLVRFVENVFKKVSRRARKAVRSVLPVSISTKLVGFSVNGVLVLALLWVLKAFLEIATNPKEERLEGPLSGLRRSSKGSHR